MKHLVPRVLNRLNLLNRVNINESVNINGRDIIVPIRNKIGYTNLFLSELWMLPLLKELLKIKQGKFIDVGVNIGQTLIKLKCVDASIEYLGFEPNPSCVDYTNELIRINQFENCEVIPSGIASETGLLELHFFSNNSADSCASIVKDFREDQKIFRKTYVPVMGDDKLKPLLADVKISIIKIDVEGAELEVIEGLKDVIESTNPFILCEILPAYNAENEKRINRQNKIQEILKSLDYKILQIIKASNSSKQHLLEIDNFNIHSDLDRCDYIFAPSGLSDKILSSSLEGN